VIVLVTGTAGFQVLSRERLEFPAFVTLHARYQRVLAQEGEVRFTVIEVRL